MRWIWNSGIVEPILPKCSLNGILFHEATAWESSHRTRFSVNLAFTRNISLHIKRKPTFWSLSNWSWLSTVLWRFDVAFGRFLMCGRKDQWLVEETSFSVLETISKGCLILKAYFRFFFFFFKLTYFRFFFFSNWPMKAFIRRANYSEVTFQRVKYVSLRLRVQNRRKKWNFPLNFRAMRKLSDLYSGIFQTQSSGCASGVDHFRNFTKLKILNIWIVKYLLNCKRNLSYNFRIFKYSRKFQNAEHSRIWMCIWNGPLQNLNSSLKNQKS